MSVLYSESKTPAIELASKIQNLLREQRLQFINNPEKFKKDYSEYVQIAKNTFDLDPFQFPLAVFDTQEIQQPFFQENGSFVFYAFDDKRMPYKVTLGENGAKARIQILPHL